MIERYCPKKTTPLIMNLEHDYQLDGKILKCRYCGLTYKLGWFSVLCWVLFNERVDNEKEISKKYSGL
jgi:hypothetical protein